VNHLPPDYARVIGGAQLIAEGRLEARKIGKRTLIPAASLRRLIEGEV